MQTEVTRDDAAGHYEITIDGKHAGFAEFVTKPGVVVFTHTEVDPAIERRGVGGELARAALDDVRERGLKAVPQCPFIRDWISKNPDYADLVQRPDSGDRQP